MPFGQTTPEHTEEYWDDHYSTFLKPLIEKNSNIIARRSEPLRGDILKQIINDIIVSPIVVADLTDKNANVFWELGVRQSFKHGTITIAEFGTTLPFDISSKGTLFYYPKNHIKMKDFTIQFEKAIQDCLSHSDRPDSQVLESISGRGTLFEIFSRDEVARRLDSVWDECQTNLKLLNIIVNIAKENLKVDEDRRVNRPFVRLRTVAIELLVTERYINEPDDFYSLIADSINLIDSLNSTLARWNELNNDDINKSLMESGEIITKIMMHLELRELDHRIKTICQL